ncbi:MAG: hypothetical protein M3Y32_13115 [Pseudomonadota bacterium]|nr:hypothetical protein [Pseudomonadota bacterium]
MLPETADFAIGATEGICYTAYCQHKTPGSAARVYQTLHILSRPLNLKLSAWFAWRFNQCLAVEAQPLEAGLARVQPQDHVLWLNPSLSVASQVEGLKSRCAGLGLYFLDPIHRLGLLPARINQWATWAQVATYSRPEGAALGIAFLAPYVPYVPADLSPEKDLDVVYVGSPSPKRLWWLLRLRLQLAVRGGRGHLRLASRSARLPRWFPGTFSARVPFEDYVELCARSRGVLELHERDADGVTVRATLAQAVNAVHLCNLRTTAQTCVISAWRWRALDRFLQGSDEPAVADRPGPGLAQWLHTNFRQPMAQREQAWQPDSPAQS